ESDFSSILPYMTGFQYWHSEWESSLENLNQMDQSEEIFEDSDHFFSPALFIELLGFGWHLVIRKPNQARFDIDKTEAKKYFPHYGHSCYTIWDRRQGVTLRFRSMELLKEAYAFCVEQAAILKIHFCMQRGKPSFGGVPASEHPGKVVIKHAY